jgi:hypothetical protein
MAKILLNQVTLLIYFFYLHIRIRLFKQPLLSEAKFVTFIFTAILAPLSSTKMCHFYFDRQSGSTKI